MKILTVCLLLLLLITQSMAQRRHESQQPVMYYPVHHESQLKKLPAKSFYQSKDRWQAIIDSTWGPGPSLDYKLDIFNAYTDAISAEFDGFQSLQMNWDSLKNDYLGRINDSTSRGGFAALMIHLAKDLRDLHTSASDNSVVNSPLNPGTPLLVVSGFVNSVSHFGAVLTSLADSSLLVLRTIDSHPLDLQPGDVIVGYEGVRWKDLVTELLDARLPVLGGWPGAPSAFQEALLISAGMNWHLFDTIDVIDHTTGDTLHLSVASLLDLPEMNMLNNEQLAVSGVPFPDYFNGESVGSGIVENTNIGYIYLYDENGTTSDTQFYEALLPLLDTDALIIDLRLNFGGWSFFNESFELMFTELLQTIEDSYRCSPVNIDLCPFGNAETFQVPGDPNSIYDRPIAVLLGPTCVSMGDITAQRLRYHPMVKFFGKPPAASMGDNLFIGDFDDWSLRYSISDMYHMTEPGSYLNRSEFPIDFPVWFDPDDVANGYDTIVEEAIEWATNVSYAHNVFVDKLYAQPEVDSVKVNVLVENPNLHELLITAELAVSDESILDSLILFDDGEHEDGEPDDGLWGNVYLPQTKNAYHITISTRDITTIDEYVLPNVAHFTTIGPLNVENYFGERSGFGELIYQFNIALYNADINTTVENVSANLSVLSGDTCIAYWVIDNNTFPDIPAQDTAFNTNFYSIFTLPECKFDSLYLTLGIEILSNNFIYWYDTIDVVIPPVPTNIEDITSAYPIEFALFQNQPNPFNPVTKIKYSLPIAENVKIEIYNTLGQTIETILNKPMPAGYHEVRFNAEDLPSGVYFYRIKAGEFLDKKKMVVIK